MAANIETMFSVREKPWHYELTKDCTKIIQEAPNSAEALKAAGLDWKVEQTEVFTNDGIVIPGYFANRRNSDNKVLGIVSGRYKVVQNEDAFAFTDALIGENEDGEVRYETAGSLNGGKRVWMLAKMPEREIVGDKFEPYVCFSNSHDGTGAVNISVTPIRVVCNNTLNIAINTASRRWTTRHIGNIEDKLSEARTCLGMTNAYMDALSQDADRLACTPLYMDTLKEIIDVMFPIEETDSEKKKTNMNRLKETYYACYLSPDIEKFMNTAWGAANAMSDMVDHMQPLRNSSNYEANRFGKIMDGHPMLDQFMELMNAKISV